ncbi:MAG TPA: tetratricopeptide repeat protein [Candidatus Limnocylindrales bacterium]|nr:tetratricopeptide repeat protein [Candidatus Limnocylindrales bacterium]
MTSTSRKTVRLPGASGAISDHSLNRLIGILIAVIAIGLPAIGLVYYADRHVDGGGSIVERTIAAAEEAVRAEPNRLSVRLALASAYAAAERHADAATQFGVVIDAEPNNQAARLGRGDALRALGQLDAAALDYQAIVDIVSDTDAEVVSRRLEAAYYGLAVIALEQNRPRDAATQLANALNIDRTDADALNLMGTALIAIGDLPNAVDALRDAVALVPTGWCEPYVQMNQAYTGLGDADGAAYAAGMTALCEGRTGDANDLLEPLAGGRYGRDALIGLALSAEQSGDATAAAAFYQRVYDADPTDFAAITGLSRLGVAVSTAEPVGSPAAGEP